MMAIFFVKYAVGVALALNASVKDLPPFIGCVSFVYGSLSGIFFAGALRMLRMLRGRIST